MNRKKRSLRFDGCADSQIPRLGVKRRGLSKGENIIHFLSPYTPVLDPDEFRKIENLRKHRTGEEVMDIDNASSKTYITIRCKKGVVAYNEDDKDGYENFNIHGIKSSIGIFMFLFNQVRVYSTFLHYTLD